jgi:predicted  nucleic acid-binding Zn-ribbon protein
MVTPLQSFMDAVLNYDRRILRLEELMADITQAESDLAAQVTATVGEISTLETQVSTLQAKIAAGAPTAEIQAAADAIETQVAVLKGAMPAAPPAAPPATGTTATPGAPTG